MRLPRLIIGTTAYLRLWQSERRENARLRRELQRWQDTHLQRVGSTPVHSTPPRVEPQQQPIIGRSAKRRYMAEHSPENRVKSAEEVLGVFN